MSKASEKQPTICVIGAGMSGLLISIKLKQAGFESLTIFEKGASVGGTWRDNTYPGLHCDVPSVSYCYTFEPSEIWQSRMSPGHIIRQYFEETSDKYGITDSIRFNTEVTDARFMDNKWQVQTSTGDNLVFDFVISACGVLHHPVIPDFEGKDSFAGSSFHTARWDHSVDLKGKRVGVIGTGSTAVQMVSPLAEECEEVHMFQRTPQWIFPLPNRKFGEAEKKLFKRFPMINKIARQIWDEGFDQGALAVSSKGWQRKFIQQTCRLHLMRIKDKELRKKLTPDYQPLCKRMVMSMDFYDGIQKENVSLETDGIQKIVPEGIVTDEGRLIELDVIVFATGFDAQAYIRPMKVTGSDGRSLEEVWEKGPKGFRTVAMPGYPNFFMVMGPNSPVGNFSLISVAETQVRYIMKCLELYRQGKYETIEPRQDVTDKFNEELVEAMGGTVWVTGCNSWYLSEEGIPGSWPWTPRIFRQSMRQPDLREFVLDGAESKTPIDRVISVPA